MDWFIKKKPQQQQQLYTGGIQQNGSRSLFVWRIKYRTGLSHAMRLTIHSCRVPATVQRLLQEYLKVDVGQVYISVLLLPVSHSKYALVNAEPVLFVGPVLSNK